MTTGNPERESVSSFVIIQQRNGEMNSAQIELDLLAADSKITNNKQQYNNEQLILIYFERG